MPSILLMVNWGQLFNLYDKEGDDVGQRAIRMLKQAKYYHKMLNNGRWIN